MKKSWVFIIGLIVGAVLMFAARYIMEQVNSNKDDFVLFENEGQVVSYNSFKVFQVLGSGDALAIEINGYGISTGMIALFYSEDGYSYYDNQIIKVPKDKCVKQIGVFRYTTKAGTEKTVPVVNIRER